MFVPVYLRVLNGGATPASSIQPDRLAQIVTFTLLYRLIEISKNLLQE